MGKKLSLHYSFHIWLGSSKTLTEISILSQKWEIKEVIVCEVYIVIVRVCVVSRKAQACPPFARQFGQAFEYTRSDGVIEWLGSQYAWA